MHRWIQISVLDAKKYKDEDGLIYEAGYFYTDDSTGTSMVEYHVDSCPKFHELMENSQFGGNLSVTFTPTPEKPALIMLGHDECIFKQYQFTNKSWVSDEGTREILPKDEGLGVMISAFQCREFGIGRPMTTEELAGVNEKRKGKEYVDGDAAMLKRGTKEKKHSPNLHSLWNSSMGHRRKAIGHTSTLCYNAKMLLIVSLICTLISNFISALTTRVVTTASVRTA